MLLLHRLLSPGHVSRLAAAGLVSVFAVLAWFGISGNVHSSTTARDVQRADALNRAYQDARLRADEAAIAAYQFVATPGRSPRMAFDTAVKSLREDLTTIEADGGPADAQVVHELQARYLVQLAVVQRFFASIEAGTTFTETLPDPTVTRDIDTLLSAPARRQDAAVQASLADYVDGQQSRIAITIVLFGMGLLLVLVCLLATSVFGRRDALAQAELRKLRAAVLTDSLTGLGNRRSFEEEMALAVTGADTVASPLSVAMVDIDEFKDVNDTWGHERGDSILRMFADILREEARAGARLYRVGGDEFAMVFTSAAAGDAAEATIERVRAAAEGRLGGTTISAGLAHYRMGEADEALLRQQADAALYEAKLRGRNLTAVYQFHADAAPVFPAAKLQAVRRLLAEGHLTAHFQPIWHLGRRSVLAYEALARPDARYELTGPQQAFDIAERFGRVADLDRLCRERILERAGDLPPHALLFINLSPYSISHHSFSADELLEEVESAGLRAERVVIEITERATIAPEMIAQAVEQLQCHGFMVAIDDVGTGNNGLEMLTKVPFDYVKIDHSIMVSALEGGTGRAALMAILAFAAEAHAMVLAEGIENDEMLHLVEVLANNHVTPEDGLIHCVQGYLLGRPSADFATAEPDWDAAAA
jgi:diguanylate cyclase (GGDEF)-like protein